MTETESDSEYHYEEEDDEDIEDDIVNDYDEIVVDDGDKIKLLITKDIGGQALLTNDIENYPAFDYIGGYELISIVDYSKE